MPEHGMTPASGAALPVEVQELRSRLAEAEATIDAIQSGEVDALLVAGPDGAQQVFTLSTADRLYRLFVERMRDGAATVSETGVILYANPRLAELLETSVEELVGSVMTEFVDERDRPTLALQLAAHEPDHTIEVELLGSTGGHVPVLLGTSWLELDDAVVRCLTFTDLRAERHWREQARVHEIRSLHDSLTGLPNRTLLSDRIEHALQGDTRQGTMSAVLFCDLNGFKAVNDTFGHDIGDQILQAVAECLTASVRPADTVARISGDEFVILCEAIHAVTTALDIAERIHDHLKDVPVVRGDPSTSGEVSLSIGVALSTPDVPSEPEELLRRADAAMYVAKRQGTGHTELDDGHDQDKTIRGTSTP